MRDAGYPSRTAILVAAARAFGSHDPDPSVRNPDWLAERLLGPDELDLLNEHPVRAALAQDYREASRDIQAVGPAMMMIIRTRFIDAYVENAIRNGATQVVILGAGFDSRAYRFHELLRDVAVFEVDAPATQEIKKRRVEAVLGGAPGNLTYVPMNFNTDKLRDVLGRAAWRAMEKTCFIWEGVSMYVAEQGVRETLCAIASQSAPGSSLVMDFAGGTVIETIKKIPDAPSVKQLTSWGEPWIFGVPDGQERDFFTGMGFQVKELVPIYSSETILRYATRKDGTLFGVVPGMPRPAPPPGPSPAAPGRGSSIYSIATLIVS